MKLSIVIPAYDRPASLAKCLACLDKQTLAKELFEVIIVDDGSPSPLEPLVKEILANYRLNFRCLRQPNGGPAKARNLGANEAGGEVIVFIGDDILADEGFLKSHFDFHSAEPDPGAVMLGLTTWTTDPEPNGFMRWLEITGFQFDYESLKSGQHTDFWHFYTSNLSIKREFLIGSGGFNESFPYAAYEDTELAYRLSKSGLKLVFNPAALAYHDHFFNFPAFAERMKKVGESARIFARLHPELAGRLALNDRRNFKTKLRNVVKKTIYPLGLFIGLPKIIHFYWHLKLIENYLQGYDQA